MVTFVGGDFGGGNVADIASAADPVTWPAGIQANDVAVVGWAMQSTATPVTTGWTVPANGAADSTSGSLRMRVMVRVLTGSESGTVSLTNTTALINRQCAVLVVYRGVDSAAIIDQIANLPETTSGTTHTNPSVTLGVANAPVLTIVGERVNTGTNAWTPPTGYIEREDSDGVATGSGGSSCAIADDGLGVSRSSGTVVTPGVWTSGNGVSTSNVVTFTLSLTPSGPTAKTLSDSASAADTLTAAATTALTDTVASADAVLPAVTVPLTDVAAAVDALAVNRPLTITDMSTAADTMSATAMVVLSDPASASDVVTVVANLTLTDAISTTDSLTATASAAVSDAATASDMLTVTVTADLADTASVSDTVMLGQPVDLIDLVSAADALSVSVLAILADATTAADVPSVAVALSLADAGAGADALSAGDATTPRAVVDVVTAVDTLTATAVLSLADMADAVDAVAVFRPGAPTRGSMTGHPRSGPDADAAVRPGPDVHAVPRGGPSTTARPRAGASMGGS